MLVLSRRETERIKLGDSIVVTVVRVSGDKVRLGIEAPSNILVLREELEPHDLEAHDVVDTGDVRAGKVGGAGKVVGAGKVGSGKVGSGKVGDAKPPRQKARAVAS
jgi:carbon storage regulator